MNNLLVIMMDAATYSLLPGSYLEEADKTEKSPPCRPLSTDPGRIIKISSMGNDITARENAEGSFVYDHHAPPIPVEHTGTADRPAAIFPATMPHKLRTPQFHYQIQSKKIFRFIIPAGKKFL